MRFSLILAAVATFVAAAPADAARLIFEISGDKSARFEIDSNPFVTSSDTSSFTMTDVAGTFSRATTTKASIAFFYGDNSGGLQIIDPVDNNDVLLDLSGPQLFTGSSALPAFTTGTFALTPYTGTTPYSLTISSVSPVPEPASWIIMLTGFALVGTTLRRQRQVAIGIRPGAA